MVKIREYRAINHSYCKNGKYDRHFSSDDLSKLFLAGINLSGAIYEFNYTVGTNNNKTIQNQINEFVSLSDVNKVCQQGSATDKELGPLQNQIDTLDLFRNLSDGTLSCSQHPSPSGTPAAPLESIPSLLGFERDLFFNLIFLVKDQVVKLPITKPIGLCYCHPCYKISIGSIE